MVDGEAFLSSARHLQPLWPAGLCVQDNGEEMIHRQSKVVAGDISFITRSHVYIPHIVSKLKAKQPLWIQPAFLIFLAAPASLFPPGNTFINHHRPYHRPHQVLLAAAQLSFLCLSGMSVTVGTPIL